MPPAIVHDYLTQRGGAERVVLAMMRTFPDAPLHTSLYDPDGTYGEFAEVDVRPLPINRFAPLRRHHRLALPFLAQTFSSLHIDADVVLCSSSGWAHGAQTSGRKIVYCYSPAKWVHQRERYGAGGVLGALAARSMRGWLREWDVRAARSADRYLVTSSAVRDWVRDAYDLEAEIVPPPGGVDAAGPRRAVVGLEPGFFLCVGRLLGYKNVGAIVEAFHALPSERLVVVGSGPQSRAIDARKPANVSILERVADDQLRWLYEQCEGLIAAAYEDYGLTPLEAASFGKPTAALRWGGFLDTVVEGRTGVLFDTPSAVSIAEAVRTVRDTTWDPAVITRHAGTFSEDRFSERLRALVAGVSA